jgi:DNA-binding response OmpR family regulator
MRLLIADDDADLALLVGYSARTLWPDCSVTVAPDGREALRRFADEVPDLVILDVMMPAPDGFEVCRRIREVAPAVPILMLTARDTVLDEVKALDLGADDYLTKPFDHLKLSARLRALTRRIADTAGRDRSGGSADKADEGASPGLVVDFKAREVRIGGVQVELTPTEYLLLEYLARHPGSILPHKALLEHVWGDEYTYDTHYLKVFMHRLRRKLGDHAGHPRFIQTCRGVGYRFVAAR